MNHKPFCLAIVLACLPALGWAQVANNLVSRANDKRADTQQEQRLIGQWEDSAPSGGAWVFTRDGRYRAAGNQGTWNVRDGKLILRPANSAAAKAGTETWQIDALDEESLELRSPNAKHSLIRVG